MSEYIFTHDWASHFRENAERIFLPLKGREIRYLEIGIFEGRSACWMLDNVLINPKSTYTGIDVSVQKNGWENLSPHTSKVTVIEGDSAIVLPHLSGNFDIIYIDGNHTALAVLYDTAFCWNLLSPGGIMLFDDYTVTDSNCGVALAVKNFFGCVPKKMFKTVLDNKQYAVEKSYWPGFFA